MRRSDGTCSDGLVLFLRSGGATAIDVTLVDNVAPLFGRVLAECTDTPPCGPAGCDAPGQINVAVGSNTRLPIRRQLAACGTYATQVTCVAAGCTWDTAPAVDVCVGDCGGYGSQVACEAAGCVWDTTPNPDVCVVTRPGGGTPTGPTIRAVSGDLTGFGLAEVCGGYGDKTTCEAADCLWNPDTTTCGPMGRANVAILITDGDANNDSDCGNDIPCVNSAIDVLHTGGIDTYVVGFAAGGTPANLNCHAVYGGTSRCGTDVTPNSCTGAGVTRECTCTGTAGTPCYYDAADGAALVTALNDIIGQVSTCDFALTQTPPSQDRLYSYAVYPDGHELRLTRDIDWVYKTTPVPAGSVTFNGSACTDIMGAVFSPLVVYGCCVGEGC